MEFLYEYGLFFAKALTFIIAIAIIFGIVAAATTKGQGADQGHIEVRKLNDKFDELYHSLREHIYDKKMLKKLSKQEQKEEKKQKKEDKGQEEPKRVYVINFYGDIKAAETEQLRECVTAVLSVASERDEVVVKLESQGGMVHSYGLASSQLARVTKASIPLTVCVDKVAASGGYMMACVANKIIAAPFAILGSIGVLAQLPNFHKLLKKNDIDYEMYTAGEYKRTVTMFGQNTPKGRKKFMEDLEDTHTLFKAFITDNRPTVDIDQVATGEIWYGTRALENGLIDEISTSDEYLFKLRQDADLYEVKFVRKISLPKKLGVAVSAAIESSFDRVIEKATTRFWS